MGAKTTKGEIDLSETNKESELEELKEYFKRTIDRMKERKIMAETRYKSIPELDKRSYMNAKWSWNALRMVYYDLQETWELMEQLALSFYETEHETTEFKKRLKELDEEFKKYRPTLREFKQALDQTQKTLRRSR